MGTRPRYKTVGKGKFFCPHCQRERNYERKAGKQYFTLYFIPLIPMGDATEFIECTHCGKSYNADVLDFKPAKATPDAARLLETVRRNLQRGQPVEYVISDLTAEGYDREIAANLVRVAGGDDWRECPKCELTFAGGVTECPDCRLTLKAKRKPDSNLLGG